MALSKIVGSLFGSGGESAGAVEGAAVEYQGYTIRPTPRRQGAQWLTAGIIAKEIGGEAREQSFIRADTHANREDAESCAIGKAKLIIDQQGEALFERSP